MNLIVLLWTPSISPLFSVRCVWDALLEEVRSQKEDQIRAGDERIIELTQREIEDRLENGDVQLVRTKDGVQEHRVPVKAKDAAVIKDISDDKRRLSLKQPTLIRSDSRSMEELAEQFREIYKEHKLRQVNSIEGECEEIN